MIHLTYQTEVPGNNYLIYELLPVQIGVGAMVYSKKSNTNKLLHYPYHIHTILIMHSVYVVFIE